MLADLAPVAGTVLVALLGFVTGRLNNVDPRKQIERDIDMLAKLQKLERNGVSKAILSVHLENSLTAFMSEQRKLRDIRSYRAGIVMFNSSLVLFLAFYSGKAIFAPAGKAEKLASLGISASIGIFLGAVISLAAALIADRMDKSATDSTKAIEGNKTESTAETADQPPKPSNETSTDRE
jgi:hypothetical protein